MKVYRKIMVLAIIGLFIGSGIIPSIADTNKPNKEIITQNLWTITITSPSNSDICSGTVLISWATGGQGPFLPIFYNVYCGGYLFAKDWKAEYYSWNSGSVSDGFCTIKVDLMVDEDLDGHGDYVDASDSIQIIVQNNNDPPVACYDCSNYNPDVDETVTFDGSCSYDPDGGSITDYYWYYTIEGGGWPVAMGHGKTLSYSWNEPGNYQVTLKVTDDEDDTAQISKDISVTGASNADLVCNGNLRWTDVNPSETVTGSFTVENNGDLFSKLDWEIQSYPDWGTWTITPMEGFNLKPSQGKITVQVFVTAPNVNEHTYSGSVTVVNKDDNSDLCVVPVSISTPKNKPINNPFLHFIQNHPHLFPMLRQILNLKQSFTENLNNISSFFPILI